MTQKNIMHLSLGLMIVGKWTVLHQSLKHCTDSQCIKGYILKFRYYPPPRSPGAGLLSVPRVRIKDSEVFMEQTPCTPQVCTNVLKSSVKVVVLQLSTAF